MDNKINYFVFKRGYAGKNLEAWGELDLFESYCKAHSINWDNLSRTFNKVIGLEDKFNNSNLFAVRVESGKYNDGDLFDMSINNEYEVVGFTYNI